MYCFVVCTVLYVCTVFVLKLDVLFAKLVFALLTQKSTVQHYNKRIITATSLVQKNAYSFKNCFSTKRAVV